MSKTETVQQLAAASNAARVQALNQQIESLRQAKLTNVEELAAMLEPLAQAMALLTEETAASLRKIERIEQRSRDQSSQFNVQMEKALVSWKQAATAAKAAADQMDRAEENAALRGMVVAVLTGLTTGLLVSALWLWLAR
ncbi:IncQ-type mobilization protein MobB [Duganella phyllosphaerae]|uniref:Mobilization protein n=1 Tax=Duganella phyllosphaerae TaxID=762836 RepID=A0A1E7X5X2_9BURK|nr:hypothetical protein DUPY_06970 [Duganella phyllosphaerae]